LFPLQPLLHPPLLWRLQQAPPFPLAVCQRAGAWSSGSITDNNTLTKWVNSDLKTISPLGTAYSKA